MNWWCYAIYATSFYDLLAIESWNRSHMDMIKLLHTYICTDVGYWMDTLRFILDSVDSCSYFYINWQHQDNDWVCRVGTRVRLFTLSWKGTRAVILFFSWSLHNFYYIYSTSRSVIYCVYINFYRRVNILNNNLSQSLAVGWSGISWVSYYIFSQCSCTR